MMILTVIQTSPDPERVATRARRRTSIAERIGAMSQNRIIEGDIPHFVDHDQWVAAQLDQFAVESVGLVGGGQAVDPLGGGGERDPVACLAGSDGEVRSRRVSCRCPADRGKRRSPWPL
jgi:hypothetical protein